MSNDTMPLALDTVNAPEPDAAVPVSAKPRTSRALAALFVLFLGLLVTISVGAPASTYASSHHSRITLGEGCGGG